ncbi:hypothetical protein HNQ80_000882 [Anaerosolibacter carboniphilus]|uniref:Uncharacterized protein n=1 Tax=Anaerosolibacter carboniphilus TaxID=1417629 RepID=A0A841KMX8_9FIRM|nr:hypothetical protein [Anaerosolibacter carboniphilus]MBB6214797.1 hypothetical protein [Anaerosolibacter carboniphilus]
MNKSFARILFVWLILLTFLFPAFSYGAENKKVLLITLNEMSFEDLYSMNSVRDMIDNGSIALMNNRTSTRANSFKAYATIGAGVRAEASIDTAAFEDINKENILIYQRRFGPMEKAQGIINLEMAKLSMLNLEGEYGAIPGALGKALHGIGLKTAAIGNGDTSENQVRLAPLIAMDDRGFVDYGSVEEKLILNDPKYPFGIKTNYEKYKEIIDTVWSDSNFISVDLSDISRLERYKNHMTEERYVQHKNIVLQEMNQFLNELLSSLSLENTRIILVTPYPSGENIKSGNKLTPIIMFGDGVEQGIMTSDTTRREGIVANVDVAPSVLAYFGIDSDDMTGRSLRFIPKEDNYNHILKLNRDTVATSNFRVPVLSTFAIFEIIVSMLGLIIILIQHRLDAKWVNRFRNVLLTTMTAPFVLLILPIFVKTNLWMTFTLLIGITALITYMTKYIRKETIDSVFFLSLITTVGLLIDVATNGTLMKSSLLGYDPIIGARYYGIGNEYMGVLIGATSVFATSLLDRFKINKIWCLMIFFITIVIIGYPGFGANVGGTMTAVAAFVFVSLRLFKVRIGIKQLFFIGTAIVAAVAFMAYIDIYLLGSKTHLAGAIQQIITEGPSIIFLIIQRKITMNLMLVGVTIWSKVLLSAIIILGILIYRPVGTLYKLTELYPNLAMGWSGIVVACIVGFLVNDSGIVASATGVIFLVMSMLYLAFYVPEEENRV